MLVLFNLLAVALGFRAVQKRAANATSVGSLITTNFTTADVLTNGGPVLAALAAIVMVLFIGPKYGLTLLKWIRRTLH